MRPFVIIKEMLRAEDAWVFILPGKLTGRKDRLIV